MALKLRMRQAETSWVQMKTERRLARVLAAVICLALAACQPAPTVALPTSTGRAPTATVETPPAEESAPVEALVTTPEPTMPAGTLLHETVALSAGGGGAALAFAGRALETVRVGVDVAGGAAAYSLAVVDMFGNRLATVEDRGLAELTLPYEGTYRLEIVPRSGSASLDVSVTRLAEPSSAWRLAGPGDEASGTFDAAGAVHSYVFPLEAGRVVAVEAAADGGDPLPVQVFGPGGEPVGGEGAAVLIAPHTGEYTVLVGGDGASGEYTLRVRRADVPPEASGTPDVEMGRDYRAALVEGSPLTLTFDAGPGDGLRVEVSGIEAPVTASVRLLSPFGQVLAFAVGEEGAESTVIREAQLPYAGRYSLEISPRDSGEARIRLVPLAPTELTGGGDLEAARAVRTGRISEPNVFHTYRVEGRMGDIVSLTARLEPVAGPLAPALALIAPAGSQVTYSTGVDSGDTVETTIGGYRLPQTGTYFVVVYGVAGGSGVYELTYERQE